MFNGSSEPLERPSSARRPTGGSPLEPGTPSATGFAPSAAGISVLATLLLPFAAGCGTDAGRAREAESSPRLAPGGATPADTTTWAEDVAPVVFEECVQCHRPGGPAPFSLRRYGPAKERAERMARHTRSRFMPPWLPEPGYADFEGERRLTDDQIRTVERWVEDGAPPGDTSGVEAPPAPESGWQLGEPDLVVEMEEAFRVPGDTTEIFRNFVIPVPAEEARWVRAVELRPGNPEVVHHAMMMIDTTRSSRRQATRDPGPGFDAMTTSSDAFFPGGFLLGWTPGRVPSRPPEGMAWRLRPGTDMVLQLHLRPTGEDQRVRARIGFQFTEERPEVTPLTLKLTSQVMDIPPGEDAYTVRDSFRLPVDVRALAVYPHAHYLGKRIHLFAELPDGDRRWLLRIDDWNFNWQDAYRYDEPVELPEGTEIRMRITYDNSSGNPQNPSDPPVRVVYGPRSTDEMGDVYLQTAVEDSASLRQLREGFARKDFRSRLAGWRAALERDPDDPSANASLGSVLQSAGRLDRAIEHFRRAVEADPDYVKAQYNLGTALEARGDLADAARRYRRTLELEPDHADAHNNLGNVLRAEGRTGEAARHFREAIASDPGHALAHNNLGSLLRARGEIREAVEHLHRALDRRPDYLAARFNLGLAYRDAGRTDSAAVHLRAAVELEPDRHEPYLTLAWLLATDPDPAERSPAEAVRLAERAVELSPAGDPRPSMVLGAAHAAAGDFEAAIDAVDRALRRARRDAPPGLVEQAREMKRLFRRGRPVIQ